MATTNGNYSGASEAAFVDYAGDLSISMINNKANEDMMRQQMQFAFNQNELAWDRNVWWLNQQRAWNHPANQRAILEAAGINAWTQYGQMASQESGGSNVQQAKGVNPPYRDASPPKANALGAYVASKNIAMQEKSMELQVQREQLENEQKMMQNAAMEYYIANTMSEDFRQLKQKGNIDYEDFKRRGEMHEAKLKEMQNDFERFGFEKSMWRYDEAAARLNLRNAAKMGRKYDIDYLSAKKGLEIDDATLRKMAQDYEKGTLDIKNMDIQNFMAFYRAYNIKEHGWDTEGKLLNNLVTNAGRNFQKLWQKTDKKYDVKGYWRQNYNKVLNEWESMFENVEWNNNK